MISEELRVRVEVAADYHIRGEERIIHAKYPPISTSEILNAAVDELSGLLSMHTQFGMGFKWI